MDPGERPARTAGRRTVSKKRRTTLPSPCVEKACLIRQRRGGHISPATNSRPSLHVVPHAHRVGRAQACTALGRALGTFFPEIRGSRFSFGREGEPVGVNHVSSQVSYVYAQSGAGLISPKSDGLPTCLAGNSLRHHPFVCMVGKGVVHESIPSPLPFRHLCRLDVGSVAPQATAVNSETGTVEALTNNEMQTFYVTPGIIRCPGPSHPTQSYWRDSPRANTLGQTSAANTTSVLP
eukprot:scaffold39246_cov59-Phaeocystis_antarctica.AAC.1